MIVAPGFVVDSQSIYGVRTENPTYFSRATQQAASPSRLARAIRRSPSLTLLFKGYAASCFALAISSRDPALAIAHPTFPIVRDIYASGQRKIVPNPEVAPFLSIEKMQLLSPEWAAIFVIGRGQQELSSKLY